MRTGSNPNRMEKANVKLEDVVFHVVTHLPSLTGYHEKRLEVVKTCLTSMIGNSGVKHSLIISDNGSVPELTEWIEDEIKPTIFIKSQNFGKDMQRKFVTRMLPPKTILCYSDDDMFFYPNWFKPQYDLLRTFPNVSSVTGYPVRTSFRWGNTNTKKWAMENAELKYGRFISEQDEKDFCVSIGREWLTHRNGTEKDLDWIIGYKGRQAYATSHHCQHIGYSGVIDKALADFDDNAMGSESGFDVELDKLGLRLSTVERLTRHMGNVIDDALRKDILETVSTDSHKMAMEVHNG